MKSPFKFLDAFTAEDNESFFGREQETAQLHFMVQKTPLLLLYGLSGTGKTSLIQCGLANKFDGPDWLPVWIRRQGNLNDSLLRAIDQLLPEHERKGAITDRVRALYNRYLRPVYLIFDQFEELVILGKNDETEQQAFAKNLKYLVQSGMPCTSILVIREEYIGSLFWLEREIPTLFDYRLRIEPMSRRKVENVLKQSFANFNISVEAPESDRFYEIIENVSKGRSGIELPYLQVYLDAFYRSDFERTEKKGPLQINERGYPALLFTQAEIRQFGDIGDVLNRFLATQQQHILQLLIADNPQIHVETVNKILNAFVSEEGTKRPIRYKRQDDNIHLEGSFIEALMLPYLPLKALNQCLEALQKARLLRINEESIELAHDSLATLIFQRRTAEERKQDEAKRSIEQAYREWTAKRGGYLTRKQIQEFSPYFDKLNLEQGVKNYVDKSLHEQRKRLFNLVKLVFVLVTIGLFIFYLYLRGEVQHKRLRLFEIVQTKTTDPTSALHQLDEANALYGDDPLLLAAYAEIYNENEFYEGYLTHPMPVNGVTFDAIGNLYSWTEKALYRWEAGQRLADSVSVQDLNTAVLSPDGRLLVAGTYDGTLLFLNAGTLEPTQQPLNSDSSSIRSLVFSPDGKHLYCTDANSLLSELVCQDSFAVETETRLDDTDESLTLCYSPPKKELFVGFKSGQMARFKGDIQFLPKNQSHRDQVFSIARAPDNKSWASAGRDALIKFWDDKNNPVLTIKGHERRINQLAWSPDGSRLFSAGNDFHVKAWSPEGDLIATYKGHRDFVNGVAISPDGRRMASAGDDKVVRIWKIESKVQQHFGPHPDGVSSIAMSADGKRVLTGADVGRSAFGDTGNDPMANFEDYIRRSFGLTPRSAYLWDATTGALIREMKGHQGGINVVAMNAAGTRLLTGSDDHTIIEWSEKGDSLRTLRGGHQGKVLALALSPDEKNTASGGYDSLLVLWGANGQVLNKVLHPSIVAGVAFSPKGDQVLTACYDGVARLYDLTGKLMGSFVTKDSVRINAVAFSPDGQYVLLGDWQNIVQLVRLSDHKKWVFKIGARNKVGREKIDTTDSLNTSKLKNIYEVSNKTGGASINALAFSPDGQNIAVAAEGGFALVFRFDGTALRPMQVLQHYPRRSIRTIAFSPDGKSVLTGSGEGWARQWRL